MAVAVSCRQSEDHGRPMRGPASVSGASVPSGDIKLQRVHHPAPAFLHGNPGADVAGCMVDLGVTRGHFDFGITQLAQCFLEISTALCRRPGE